MALKRVMIFWLMLFLAFVAASVTVILLVQQ